MADFTSHFHHLGLRVCKLSYLDTMECPAQTKHQGCFVRLDGRWYSVSCNTGLAISFYSPNTDRRDSTGACCIVRTVLNYQSIPEDKTCEWAVSCISNHD